jgi:hypothetical protein
MANIQDPVTAQIAEVDASTSSLRVVQRPAFGSALGSYAASLQSGVMAAGLGAAAEVFQFRYGGANLCLVERVVFDGLGGIVAFTPGVAQFRLFISRSYTASGSGGTAATLTTNNCKLRTSYATTAVADIRIASTAALTSPAGDVPDAQPMGAVIGYVGAAPALTLSEMRLYDAYSTGHPIILAQNEGLILQATVPATGTWTFGVSVRWSEITAAEWA